VNDRLFRAARGRLLGVPDPDDAAVDRLVDAVERDLRGVGGP
jgi:hypothetical protein